MKRRVSDRQVVSSTAVNNAGLDIIEYTERLGLARLEHLANQQDIHLDEVQQVWILETTAYGRPIE